ncbi:Colicin I receptor precursor [Delftia tsuruhatensis]|uniref:TonB-dependent receptor domain-containing protein n=1 Tax=Delftia tsuruhatensis TaxID=180282 RepID=UPI001E6F9C01|nr:TonB-dependent receptor [Delftia tsuruhatensis]CAB5658831.1 Colicin I receptor precursor [Delftia tsuruhatensis]CAC9679518.1 Colicin I receptor precursor [Delftia tsuruhatensis]
MKPVLRLALRPLSLACLSAVAAMAQAGQQEPPLPTIVVTASGNAQEIQDAPASISVLTADDLRTRPAHELSELLTGIEGVTLNRTGNGTPTIQIRGFDAAYTLMLIDGKRVNASTSMFRGGAGYDSGWVPLDDIERVEVVRGPMSSLYGADAIGGVVNIITRPVGKAWKGSVTTEAVLSADRDLADSQKLGFSMSGPLIDERLGLKLYGNYDHRAPSDARDPLNNPVTPLFGRILNRHAGGQLSWRPDARQTVTLDADLGSKDHGGYTMERDAFSLRHKGSWGRASTELTLASDEIRNLKGMVDAQVNPNHSNTYSLNGKLSFAAFGNQFLTMGIDARKERLWDPVNLSGWPGAQASAAAPSTSVNQYAIFIEDEIRITERLALTLGNRFDHHQNFGGHHSPRAYGVFHLNDAWTLKGGVSRAFRTPTLVQNSPNWGSVSCGSATTGCYIIGSRDLKPETALSKEIGVQYARGAHSASLMLFDTRLRNMIDIDSRTRDPLLAPQFDNFVGFLPDGRPIFSYQNINSARTRGVEASWKWQAMADLGIKTAYTYLDAKNTSKAQATRLINRSRHNVHVAADWRVNGRWSLGAAWRLQSEQPLNTAGTVRKGGYGIVDLSAAWQFSKDSSLRTGVLNLGDRTFERSAGNDYSELGRRFYVSLHSRF